MTGSPSGSPPSPSPASPGSGAEPRGLERPRWYRLEVYVGGPGAYAVHDELAWTAADALAQAGVNFPALRGGGDGAEVRSIRPHEPRIAENVAGVAPDAGTKVAPAPPVDGARFEAGGGVEAPPGPENPLTGICPLCTSSTAPAFRGTPNELRRHGLEVHGSAQGALGGLARDYPRVHPGPENRGRIRAACPECERSITLNREDYWRAPGNMGECACGDSRPRD